MDSSWREEIGGCSVGMESSGTSFQGMRENTGRE